MRPIFWRRFDWPLFGLALLLSAFGVMMVSSALSGNQVLADYPLRQAGFLAVGLVLLFVTAAIDYRFLTSIAKPAYLFLLGMLLVVAVLGTISGGAQRWIALGELFLQPSELIKLAVILLLAQYLADREETMHRLTTPFGAILIIVPAVVMIYLQPNLGTALCVLVIGAVLLMTGGLRWYQAIVFLGLAALAAVPAWQYLLHDYMKNRILTFVDPAKASAANTSIDTFNIDQAMISIGSGGWLGRGLFRGSQNQLHFLRVRHTDFIFSVVAEELGFVGAVLVIVLMALLLLRLVRIAALARDSFGRLIVIGVITMILWQLAVNVGMNLNLLPVSGMPLPLISYGGSSLWSTLIGIGLAESVAMRHKKIEFE
ncbi:MAG TPA: rod shape-determining protein RodA [Anaerolineae bacterium]